MVRKAVNLLKETALTKLRIFRAGSGFGRTSIEGGQCVGAFLNEARSTPKNGHRQFDPLLPKSAMSGQGCRRRETRWGVPPRGREQWRRHYVSLDAIKLGIWQPQLQPCARQSGWICSGGPDVSFCSNPILQRGRQLW